MSVKLNLIAAACQNMGIGINGTLPWRLKNEMSYFTKKTSTVQTPGKQNAVIMGRVTWDCIPQKYKPLTGRVNIVLTRNVDKVKANVAEGVVVVPSLDAAIKHIEERDDIEAAWVIGGSDIYKAAMQHQNCDRIYLTQIEQQFECDTYFPEIDNQKFAEVQEDGVPTDIQVENTKQGEISYRFKVYKKVNLD